MYMHAYIIGSRLQYRLFYNVSELSSLCTSGDNLKLCIEFISNEGLNTKYHVNFALLEHVWTTESDFVV